MAFEIPLNAAQAIANAAQLAATVDTVAASLRQVVTQSELVNTAIKGIDQRGLADIKAAVGAVGVEVRKLQADTVGQKLAIQDLRKETTTSVQAISKQYEDLNKKLAQTSTAIARTAQSTKMSSAAAREHTEAIARSKSTQKTLTDEISRGTLAAVQANTETGKSVEAKKRLSQQFAGLSQAYAKSRLSVEQLAKAEVEAAASKENSAKAMDRLRASLAQTTDTTGRQRKGISDLKAAQDAYNETAAKTARVLQLQATLQTAVANSSAGRAAATAGMANLAASEKQIKSAVALRAANAASYAQAVQAHQQTLQNAAASQTLGQRIQALTGHTNRLTSSVRVGNQATSAMRAGMIASGTSFGIFTSETIVAAVAVYGLVSALRAVITVGAQFEDAMTRAFAIMDVTGDLEATRQLTEFVREIGKTTKFTSTQAAEGLVLLGMAGLNTEQSMDALLPALNVASIGMVDMAFAADFLTNVMNEFGLTSKDIAHISDVLAVAVVAANVNMEQLAISLSYIGPIAESANNSLEDTVAMIQVMGDNAIKASRAGTALRRAMANLIEPNDQAAATMARLGVSVRDLDGEMIPLIDFMKQMAAAGAEVDDVFTLFGLYAAPGMQTILKDLKTGFDENGVAIEGHVAKVERYAAALEDATGSADKLREEMEDTLVADSLMFWSAAADVALTSFEEMQAELRSLVQSATQFLRELNPETIRDFTRGIVAMTGAIVDMAFYGTALFAFYKVFVFGAATLRTAAAASQAVAFASGTMVGPLTASATGMQGAAFAANAYTPAALRASLATRGLTTAFLMMQTALWPLLIFSAIAFAIYKFSSASSEGADNSARLRVEMELERRAAEELAGATEGVTAAKKELANANDRDRVRANTDQIAEYAKELAEQEKKLKATLLEQSGVQSGIFGQISFTPSEDFKAGYTDQIQEITDGITQLQASIQILEEDTASVTAGISEREEEYARGRQGRVADITRAAEIYNETLQRGADILSGMSIRPSDSITNLAATRAAGGELDLKSLVELEEEKSEIRFGIFDRELKLREQMQQAALDRQASLVENNELQIHSQKKSILQQSYESSMAFVDEEMTYLRANAASLAAEIERWTSQGLGGPPLEQAQSAYELTMLRLRELMDLSEEYSDEYVLEQERMRNAALKLWQAEEDRVRGLVSEYDPLMGALIKRNEQEMQLNELIERKIISEDAAARAMQAIQFEYNSVRTPVAQFLYNLESEIELLQAQAEVTRTGNYDKLIRLQLIQQGVTATEDEIAALIAAMKLRDQLSQNNKDLANEADPFQKAWEEAIKRVDEAFEDMWMGAFDSFSSFKDRLIDAFKQLMAALAHETISKPILINMGILPAQSIAAGGRAASAVTGAGSAASGLSGMYGILSGGLTQTMAKTSAYSAGILQNLGFEGFATSSVKQANVMAQGGSGALINMGQSLVAGAAGSYAGDALGQAIFGKQAESAIAAGVLGAFGTVVGGPLGAFIGSSIGAALDVAFGGDGKERLSAGFSVGPAAVRSSYEYGTTTFDSGLQVTNIARRVGQDVSDKVISQLSSIDSLFTSVSRAAGIDVDLSKTNLKGSSADAGVDGDGSFFGIKGYNNLKDAEAQLAAQSVDFLKKLIAEVSGSLSSEVVAAVNAATGTAEDILNHYGAVLALDGIFKSGSKLFTNIDNFSDTMTALSEQFQLEGESLGETVTRIKVANESLNKVGLGDGSTTDTLRSLEIAKAAGSLENLTAIVDAFAETVSGREKELENVTARLRGAVTTQFAELGLVIDDFTVDEFREHFDSLKDSVDAVDVVKLMQAGNSLALLTQLEAELASVREESVSEASESFREVIGQITALRGASLSIRNMINDLRGVSEAPTLESNSVEDRIEYYKAMAQFHLSAYEAEAKLEEDLHKQAVANYEEQLELSKSIGTFLNSLQTGDLSILSSQERRDLAYSNFNDLATRAEGGDLEAAAQLTKAAEEFLKIERQRETTGERYIESYTDVVGRLSGLKDQLGLATDPGEFSPRVLTDQVISELQVLQDALSALQSSISSDAVRGFLSLGDRIAFLPAEIRKELKAMFTSDLQGVLDFGALLGVVKGPVVAALSLLPKEDMLNNVGIAQQIEMITALSQFPNVLSDNFSATMMQHLEGLSAGLPAAMQYALNLDSLKDPLVQALGLLPDKESLSAMSIAEHIDQLTQLSAHPYILSNSFSAIVGAMMSTMLANGASPATVANAVASNPNTNSAANQYLNDTQGGGNINWYTTEGQAAVANHMQQVVNNNQDHNAMANQIFQDAIANNVSSAQLAYIWNQNNPNEQYTPAQLQAWAASMGIPAFAKGGVVSSATLGIFGEAGTEVITPVKDYTTLERENLVGEITSATQSAQREANREVVAAIKENTRAVESNSGSNVVHLKVVTADGKELVNQTIDTIKQRSKNGEIVIHSKGVSK